MAETKTSRTCLHVLFLCLITTFAVSCTCGGKGLDKGAKHGPAAASAERWCELRSVGGTSFSSNNVGVDIAGHYNQWLELRRFCFVNVQAHDEHGEALVTKLGTLPDSKLGPMAWIHVVPASASTQIVVCARLEYKKRPIALRAEFVREGDSGRKTLGWKSTNVTLTCEE